MLELVALFHAYSSFLSLSPQGQSESSGIFTLRKRVVKPRGGRAEH